jgi:hypothetical protein
MLPAHAVATGTLMVARWAPRRPPPAVSTDPVPRSDTTRIPTTAAASSRRTPSDSPHLRAGQLAGMRALVAGRDVQAVMPTGYGKSAIYQAAALQLHRNHGQDEETANPGEPGSARRGPAVVVPPLIALQEDQLDSLMETLGGSAAVAINSGHSDSEANDATEAALRRLADDPLRPEDLAGNRPAPHHARLPHVHRTQPAPGTQAPPSSSPKTLISMARVAFSASHCSVLRPLGTQDEQARRTWAPESVTNPAQRGRRDANRAGATAGLGRAAGTVVTPSSRPMPADAVRCARRANRKPGRR